VPDCRNGGWERDEGQSEASGKEAEVRTYWRVVLCCRRYLGKVW
jgi:hypothetical protein